jgi:hypothetical protein
MTRHEAVGEGEEDDSGTMNTTSLYDRAKLDPILI